MSKSECILILMGYDYVDSIEKFIIDPNFYLIITQHDIKYFKSGSIERLKFIMNERVIFSVDSDSDIHDLLNSGKFACLITLGWRKHLRLESNICIKLLVNIHPALLPEYKGYHPVPYVLLNNENTHGITAHLITEEYDSGAILLRKEFPISPFSTLPSLQHLVHQEMPGFLEDLMKMIIKGKIKTKENNGKNTKVFAPKRKPEDSEVFLNDSVEQMFRKVKASDNERFPAYFVYNGEKVFIRLYRGDGAKKQTNFDI